jgi:signal transduction histidine kinase
MELTRRHDDRGPTHHGLISHMQTVTEREKAFLARELHDELGGLLVAASMDLAWLERYVASPPHEVRRRLARLREALAAAVDMKRKIIEDLRPTLLDNVGLFAALGWFVNNACARGALKSTINFPPLEPHFNPDASIALFRIAQEALAVALQYKWVQAVTLTLEVTGPVLTLSIAGRGQSAAAEKGSSAECYELAAIRHRTASLGGGFRFSTDEPGEVSLCAWAPLANMLAG